MATKYSEFLSGIRDELPILAGVIPFGMIYGVSALAAGIPAIMAQAMSCIVFAGASQFIITQLVSVGTPPLVIVLTTFIVNIRHALYSATLAPYVQRLPARWKWLLAYLLTDEAYAVTILHYRKDEPLQANIREQGTGYVDVQADTGKEIVTHQYKHWYFFGAGLALWTTWQLSTASGIFLGAHIPSSWSLDFASTLTFIALVVPSLKDRATIGAALSAGIVAVLVVALPFRLNIAAAALTGVAIGLLIEQFIPSKLYGYKKGKEQEDTTYGGEQ